MPVSRPALLLPCGLKSWLYAVTRAVVCQKPKDVTEFIATYCQQLYEFSREHPGLNMHDLTHLFREMKEGEIASRTFPCSSGSPLDHQPLTQDDGKDLSAESMPSISSFTREEISQSFEMSSQIQDVDHSVKQVKQSPVVSKDLISKEMSCSTTSIRSAVFRRSTTSCHAELVKNSFIIYATPPPSDQIIVIHPKSLPDTIIFHTKGAVSSKPSAGSGSASVPPTPGQDHPGQDQSFDASAFADVVIYNKVPSTEDLPYPLSISEDLSSIAVALDFPQTTHSADVYQTEAAQKEISEMHLSTKVKIRKEISDVTKDTSETKSAPVSPEISFTTVRTYVSDTAVVKLLRPCVLGLSDDSGVDSYITITELTTETSEKEAEPREPPNTPIPADEEFDSLAVSDVTAASMLEAACSNEQLTDAEIDHGHLQHAMEELPEQSLVEHERQDLDESASDVTVMEAARSALSNLIDQLLAQDFLETWGGETEYVEGVQSDLKEDLAHIHDTEKASSVCSIATEPSLEALLLNLCECSAEEFVFTAEMQMNHRAPTTRLEHHEDRETSPESAEKEQTLRLSPEPFLPDGAVPVTAEAELKMDPPTDEQLTDAELYLSCELEPPQHEVPELQEENATGAISLSISETYEEEILAAWAATETSSSPETVRHTVVFSDDGSTQEQTQSSTEKTSVSYSADQLPETSSLLTLDTLETEVAETDDSEVPETVDNEVAETVDSEVAETVDSEVAKTVVSEVPETDDSEVPETVDNEVAETVDSEVAETVDSEVAKTVVSEVPETVDSEVPETVDSEVPETIDSEVVETTDNEVPETVDNEVTETVNSDVAETVDSEVPETVDSEVPETVDSEVPETVDNEVVETVNGDVAVNIDSEVPETFDSEVPETDDSEVAETVDSEVPETVDSEIAETVDSEVPEMVDSEVPEMVDSEVTETVDSEVAETVDSEVPETVDSEVPETVDSEVPETVDSEVPETIDSEGPETVDSEVPETIDSEGPETVDSEVPETVDSEVTETVDSEVPAMVDSEVTETVDIEVAETVDSEVPETVDSEVPETVDSEGPETVDSEVPETVHSEVPETVDSEVPETVHSEVAETVDSEVLCSKVEMEMEHRVVHQEDTSEVPSEGAERDQTLRVRPEPLLIDEVATATTGAAFDPVPSRIEQLIDADVQQHDELEIPELSLQKHDSGAILLSVSETGEEEALPSSAGKETASSLEAAKHTVVVSDEESAHELLQTEEKGQLSTENVFPSCSDHLSEESSLFAIEALETHVSDQLPSLRREPEETSSEAEMERKVDRQDNSWEAPLESAKKENSLIVSLEAFLTDDHGMATTGYVFQMNEKEVHEKSELDDLRHEVPEPGLKEHDLAAVLPSRVLETVEDETSTSSSEEETSSEPGSDVLIGSDEESDFELLQTEEGQSSTQTFSSHSEVSQQQHIRDASTWTSDVSSTDDSLSLKMQTSSQSSDSGSKLDFERERPSHDPGVDLSECQREQAFTSPHFTMAAATEPISSQIYVLMTKEEQSSDLENNTLEKDKTPQAPSQRRAAFPGLISLTLPVDSRATPADSAGNMEWTLKISLRTERSTSDPEKGNLSDHK